MGKGFRPSGLGTYVYDDTPVVRQLVQAGILPYLVPLEITATAVHARADRRLITALRRDARFAAGSLHHLHPEVGQNRRDFRAYRGTFGPGSLQIVIDADTGNFYADVDAWNPYEDVVGWLGHAGEVVRGWWRTLRGG